jgi:uncharacterized protein with HEPN domain
MSQHDDQVYLKHMLDHAREAVERDNAYDFMRFEFNFENV